MDSNKERALKVAEFLLQIAAVKLSPENPFTWASGMKSPIYCDNRKTLSYPDIRRALTAAFSQTIHENYPDAEVIAGVATGGIAIGALVADMLDLPFIYVRSEAKKHGLGNQVEGVLLPGQKVVVIEDLISTGKSSLTAVEALRQAEADVLGMVAIFTYGFPKAVENFVAANCKLDVLSSYDALLEQAEISASINPQQKNALVDWRLDPEAWSAKFNLSN